ncbi:MAG: tRNA (adenosine(37)-N6)-threonylcarbamoyltransferase complex dimerization subunit type 1 TsaB [Bacteroidales bacterium]|jgi:tRNA threonylcarbamoyladenosine biosynthesis protein TsaB|nr:tRNA (adenosine(37)-N6)-threonylcarbamoyltransferase complex dimerization subunit type 1 TsaB [Bacteroidales bacterium]
MAYLLAIETSTEICSVALGKDATCVALIENTQGNTHAEKILVFIDQILQQANIPTTKIDAVCVSAGPGSYTGLRIGVSSAKGLCDALDIPLIAVSTLQSMAWGAKTQYPDYNYYCPMIDARRMEVYSAVYDADMQTIQEVTNVVLYENTYSDFLKKDKLVFSGNALTKLQTVLSDNPNAVFAETKTSARYLLALAYEQYINRNFADTAYFEPFYLKEFHAVLPKTKRL